MTLHRTAALLLSLTLLANCDASQGSANRPTAVPSAPVPPPASTDAAPEASPAAATPSTEPASARASASPAATAPPAASDTPASSAASPGPQAAASASAQASAAPAGPPATVSPAWIYPIRFPGRQPGDGFVIRHGFQTENTWYNPGDWHSGEDWYALEGDTAGAEVVAVAPGEVEYADGNYPGRVVIVRHDGDLRSMYGHLDPALAITRGQQVERGQLLGTVLRRGDETPNHLHFELRSFLAADPVNGPAPRYAYRCGPNCPPGPGYWPIDAPELPGAVGWFNPIHVIAANAWPEPGAAGELLVATAPASPTLNLWDTVDQAGAPAGPAGTLTLEPGARYTMLESRPGPRRPLTTSAESYTLWYRLALPDGRTAWAAGLVADDNDTGSDGRPSSIRFNLLPIAFE